MVSGSRGLERDPSLLESERVGARRSIVVLLEIVDQFVAFLVIQDVGSLGLPGTTDSILMHQNPRLSGNDRPEE